MWLLGLFLCCVMTCAYGYSFSAPSIIQHLTGLSITNVGFIVAGIGLLAALSMVLNSIRSDRAGERYLHIIFPCMLMTFGYLVGGLTTAPLIAIPAFAATVMSFYATQGPVYSIPAEFLKGRSAAAGYAAVNMLAILARLHRPILDGLDPRCGSVDADTAAD